MTITKFGISKFGETKVTNLSIGMKQKESLVHDSDIFCCKTTILLPPKYGSLLSKVPYLHSTIMALVNSGNKILLLKPAIISKISCIFALSNKY